MLLLGRSKGLFKLSVHNLLLLARDLMSFGLLGHSRSESKGDQQVSAKDCSTAQFCNV